MSSSPRTRSLITASMIITLLLIIMTAASIIKLVPNSEEAVKIRNSLIANVGQETDFTWTPDKVPKNFRLETSGVPDEFERIAEKIITPDLAGKSNFEKTLLIARHLSQLPARGGAIMSTTRYTYEQIVSTGKGYCADYTQVFNALAIASDIPVREWGFAFEEYGNGHAFNEIYDPGLGKWIMVDVFNSFYLKRLSDGVPVSVMELREALLEGVAESMIEVVPIVKDNFGFKSYEKLFEYYARGKDQFFLWWGNDVFTYERHPLIRFSASLPRSLEQGLAIIFGVHPEIRLIKSDGNDEHIQALYHKRNVFFGLVLLFAVLIGLFVVLLRFKLRELRAS